ncbi:MAG: hypothetical protein JWQ78_704, partial [Sediminibacterium sp.]|nr:hypothetical protein [Sediminibacterium sp.]
KRNDIFVGFDLYGGYRALGDLYIITAGEFDPFCTADGPFPGNEVAVSLDLFMPHPAAGDTRACNDSNKKQNTFHSVVLDLEVNKNRLYSIAPGRFY